MSIPLDEDLRTLLVRFGLLGLVASRLPETSPYFEEARAALRQQALASRLQEDTVWNLLQAFRAAGIETLFFKGLAVACFYPQAGARPTGDVDLLVRAEDLGRAAALLRDLGYTTAAARHVSGRPCVGAKGPDGIVDVHTELWPLPAEETLAAFHAPDTLRLHDATVPVLPTLTHVRYQAVHAAKHHFVRPLWVCDLALSVEERADLDWHHVLAGSWHVRSWIVASLGMADRLLGLHLPASIQSQCRESAGWLEPFVLTRWGDTGSGHDPKTMLAQAISRPINLGLGLRALRAAWPDPVDAQANLRWPLSPALAAPSVVLAAAQRALSFVRAGRSPRQSP